MRSSDAPFNALFDCLRAHMTDMPGMPSSPSTPCRRGADHRRHRRHHGLRRGRDGLDGLCLGLARLRRLVRSEGRHDPASPRGHRRRPPSVLADNGPKASSIGRRAASIAYHHTIAGHTSRPTPRPSAPSCAASFAPSRGDFPDKSERARLSTNRQTSLLAHPARSIHPTGAQTFR